MSMQHSVFTPEEVNAVVEGLRIPDLAGATIGQVVLIARELERRTGSPFIRMDQGVPGLDPCRIGIEAEKEALESGVAAIYPAAEGVPELKGQTSRFVKAFLDVDISPEACIPVTGSVAGSFGSFIVASQCTPGKDTVLFIDPGFPIQKSQLRILGVRHKQFDIYAFRGEALREKLEGFLREGDIAAIIYSNPNNPAWICLEESELRIIGELATKYDTIVLEDLAYFAMDFRRDLSRPFAAPFQATVARYTDNWMLMLSASKIFSYAGQRAGVVCIGDRLFHRHYPALAQRYATSGFFGNTFVNAVMYMITSGVAHSVQYGLAAMYRAAADGEIDFVEETRAYGRRAARMKHLFAGNGFHVVYDKDVEEAIGDGFFFTIGYPGMSSGSLMRELLYYGISSIALGTTGSEQEGVRACSSRISEPQFEMLEQRLKGFRADHPVKSKKS